MTTVTAAITGRTDFMLKRRPPHPSHDENRREAKISFAEIDSGAGMSRLQNEEERVAGRGLYPRGRNLLLPGLRGRRWLHLRHRRQDRLLAPRPETDEGRVASWLATRRRS